MEFIVASILALVLTWLVFTFAGWINDFKRMRAKARAQRATSKAPSPPNIRLPNPFLGATPPTAPESVAGVPVVKVIGMPVPPPIGTEYPSTQAATEQHQRRSKDVLCDTALAQVSSTPAALVSRREPVEAKELPVPIECPLSVDPQFDNWLGETGNRYPPDWEARKIAVRARDGGRCVVSGCLSIEALHVHHLKPISRGGVHRLENLITVCELHHVLMPDHLEPMRERIMSSRYHVVGGYFAANPRSGGFHAVRTHFHRTTMSASVDAYRLIEVFDLKCRRCAEPKSILWAEDLEGDDRKQKAKGGGTGEYRIRVLCGDCNEAHYFAPCLTEELGLQMTEVYQSKCPESRVPSIEQQWLADMPKPISCPPCPRHGCNGHKVWKARRRDGVLFQGCLNWPNCQGR